MPAVNAFIDTNVLLYLFSQDTAKADRAEAIIQTGGVISVQVLNEIANVARRKLGIAWPDTLELLELIRALCVVNPVTIEMHSKGLQIAERYGFSIYDSMIIAAALLAGCERLYSEDLQHGQLIDKQLRLCNPFLK
jgi:predicted nucleic acid-binding protein